MVHILDGTAIALATRMQVAGELRLLGAAPHLVVLLTHPNPASSIYVRNKLTACQEAGIRVTLIDTPCSTTAQVLSYISTYNNQSDVDGILVQTPLHPDVDFKTVVQAINPEKDVDGAHPINLGKLAMSDSSGFVPCTPLGIQRFFVEYSLLLRGKHVVIVGRSVTVGKPLALLLSQNGKYADATVTLANRKTNHLRELCSTADVLVAAAGTPHLISADFVREGAVVIDVGINRMTIDGKNRLVGDVDFEKVAPKCSAITPVPGGVGPMTIAALLVNTLKSYRLRNNV